MQPTKNVLERNQETELALNAYSTWESSFHLEALDPIQMLDFPKRELDEALCDQTWFELKLQEVLGL